MSMKILNGFDNFACPKRWIFITQMNELAISLDTHFGGGGKNVGIWKGKCLGS